MANEKQQQRNERERECAIIHRQQQQQQIPSIHPDLEGRDRHRQKANDVVLRREEEGKSVSDFIYTSMPLDFKVESEMKYCCAS